MKFIIKGNFYEFVDEEEAMKIIEEKVKKTGVFQDQLTNKLILSLGFCVDENIASHQTMTFISRKRKLDPDFHKNIVAKHILNIVSEIIKEILNEDDLKMTFHEKKIRVHLDSYLRKISSENLEEAIEEFANVFMKNLDVLIFITHLKNLKSQTDYNLLFAPSIFSFISTSFTNSYKNKSEYMIYSKQIIITSDAIMEAIWLEILKNAVKYYIYAVFDFQKVE